MRIISPALAAGNGIQSQNTAERRAEEESAIDIERGGLEAGGIGVLRLIFITSAKSPGDLQRGNIRAVDDGERREALATGIAPVSRPVAGLCERKWRGQGTKESEKAA